MNENDLKKRRPGALQILGLLLLALFGLWAGIRIWTMFQDRLEPVSAITYKQIESQISRGTSLTQAQLAHQISEFQGKKVRWTGTIEEVDDANMVFIDMDSLLYDVRFNLPLSEALRLSKGNRVIFVGVIDRIERFWLSVRVQLRSVKIESVLE